MRNFLIVSESDDLHALAVQASTRARGFNCDIVEANELHGRESINFSIGNDRNIDAVFRTSEEKLINLSELDTVWWRRFKAAQSLNDSELTPDHQSLISNDCFGALYGSLESAFRGRWISRPSATEYASNKINQLKAAVESGFRIPDTIISQSPGVVRKFFDKHQSKIIIKPVIGTRGPLIFTRMVSSEYLDKNEEIRSCPAIYQEYIDGTNHLRLNCFGNKSFCGLIDSNDLDWRPNLEVPISPWKVSVELHSRARRVLDNLGLEMGIIDLKITPEGEYVWLEVNPQGQFLFLEGITGLPLTEYFVDFFVGEYL